MGEPQRAVWLAEQIDEVDAEHTERGNAQTVRLERIESRLTGILIAVATSAVLLAINIAIGSLGR